LKKRFTTEPILVTPDLDRKMRMEMNVLDYTIEEVMDGRDQWHISQNLLIFVKIQFYFETCSRSKNRKDE